MDKCPYCDAETRPGDNFCLNCGNRLLSATPSSSQQAQPAAGEATVAAADDWAATPGSAPANSWSDGAASLAPTIADSSPAGQDFPTMQEATLDTVQTADSIEEPARFALRSDEGEVVQEYPLDKPEITIGRAPNSDILLSKDKLTSRRHATVRYEGGRYVLHDERSANGTFVNGQQIEDTTPYELQDGDHVGIGEHELVFYAFNSRAEHGGIDELPTQAVQYDEPPQDVTYRTREDALATLASNDEFGTHASYAAAEEPEAQPVAVAAQPPMTPSVEQTPVAAYAYTAASNANIATALPEVADVVNNMQSFNTNNDSANAVTPAQIPVQYDDASVTFNRLANLPLPTLPDMSALMAALSTLDGQVMSLQQQFNATQDAVRNHEAEVLQVSNQLRVGIRRVSERMDNTIADVARSREALSWAELLQLMEDVMNNPRDIEYVTKLARKARELNKVFQIHQNVLNTMAECNSLLRSMIGEDK